MLPEMEYFPIRKNCQTDQFVLYKLELLLLVKLKSPIDSSWDELWRHTTKSLHDWCNGG